MYGSRIEVDVIDGAVSHILVPGAPQRKSLTVFPPSVGLVIISNEPIPAGGNGVPLTPNMHPYHVSRESHGNVCTMPHYISYSGGAQFVAFVQVLD